MRIANMLQSDGPGGAEIMMLRLSEQLRERAHTVVPVTAAGGIGWLGVQYERLGFVPEKVRVDRRWIDTTFLRDLLGVIRRHSIQLVHSHEFEMAVYGAVASRIAGIPHVITMHGGLTVWKALQRRIAFRWAVRNSDATVVVSDATRRQFAREFSLPQERFRVIPNGVPVVKGEPLLVRQEFRCEPHDLVFLAVGNLERNKGHRELIEALLQLNGTALPWKLVIAGGRGGPEHTCLVDYIHHHRISDRVHIVTNRSDIPDLQAMADIFVMPSLWEGLPMALLEAMVAGKAVVASATGGIPEAVNNEREGLLVPPGDVEKLSQALKRLIENAALRTSLGQAARRRALAEFTVGAMTTEYEALYANVSGLRADRRRPIG